MTPPANPPVNNVQTPVVSTLTQALNLFDTYASLLSVRDSLKFKKSLKVPDAAEMFLQYNDEERMEHIREILETV